jgi:hypothetical protein
MFNNQLFLNDIKNIHLNTYESTIFSSINDRDVRSRLDSIIDIDSTLISHNYGVLNNSDIDEQMYRDILDNICNNIVGNTMFKILLIKMRTTNDKIHLMSYNTKKGRSTFSQGDFAVIVNLSMFEPSIIDNNI